MGRNEGTAPRDQHVDLGSFRQLITVMTQIHHGAGLADTLQAVADGVVDGLGYASAAVSYVGRDGILTVMAVTGPPDAKEALLGQRMSGGDVEELLGRSRPWGSLRFVDHEQADTDVPWAWTPRQPPIATTDGWHAGDGLLAPLRSPAGSLVGLLSVDLTPGAPMPGRMARELLEAFATGAGIAIDRAALIDQLQSEHAQLQASAHAFRFAFRSSAAPMARLSLSPEDLGCFRDVNDAFSAAIGTDVVTLLGQSWFDLLQPEDLDRARQTFEELVAGRRRSDEAERQLRRRDGSLLWAALTWTVIADAPGYPPFLLLHLRDVTERRAREEILRRQSVQDPLTGLANRRSLHHRLGELLTASQTGGPGGVVIYGDLDDFKSINDHRGHAAGDAALRQVAQMILGHVRPADIVARPGGDEFVIVAADTTLAEGRALADRIRAATDDITPSPLRLSLGVVPFDVATDVEGLLEQADLAMYADKQRPQP